MLITLRHSEWADRKEILFLHKNVQTTSSLIAEPKAVAPLEQGENTETDGLFQSDIFLQVPD